MNLLLLTAPKLHKNEKNYQCSFGVYFSDNGRPGWESRLSPPLTPGHSSSMVGFQRVYVLGLGNRERRGGVIGSLSTWIRNVTPPPFSPKIPVVRAQDRSSNTPTFRSMGTWYSPTVLPLLDVKGQIWGETIGVVRYRTGWSGGEVTGHCRSGTTVGGTSRIPRSAVDGSSMSFGRTLVLGEDTDGLSRVRDVERGDPE